MSVIHSGSPVGPDDPGFPIYSTEFNLDPHAVYDELRARFGALAPVELAPGVPATLVVGYHTAVRILHDPDHFPADPRSWQRKVSEDCPLRSMMEWYPAARYTTGLEHARYRQASVDAIDAIDLASVRAHIEEISAPLLESIGAAGRADLAGDYAFPLLFGTLNKLIGVPPEIGQRMALGMAARFDSTKAAGSGMDMLETALRDLIALKNEHPENDITTRLIQHSADLDSAEVGAQLMSFYGAGVEAGRNLILNVMLLMLTEPRFGGGLIGGSLSTRDAIDEVLFENPPMANFCTTYPRQPVLIEGTWLPADQPVVISIAACNTDPAVADGGSGRTGNRSHLAWSAGPHVCPARTVAYLMVQDSIDILLDVLPDIELSVPAVELTWRPGPFHRSLTALPVTVGATG
ncbi:cytochrome P450 [Nocardia nova]|uniref:cytochrome P450 n=1 Tax=Nocardia nova TaxID=37330 RepID=UPI0033E7C703